MLRWSCLGSAAAAGLWCILALFRIVNGGSFEQVPVFVAWVLAVAGLGISLLWLARAANRPIRELGSRATPILVAVFVIRIVESLQYVFTGGILFLVYTFLAILGLWTVWSMEGVEQTGLTRLAFLAGVFAFLWCMFAALAAGNVITGLQPLQDLFWVLTPQAVLLAPHVLFVWGAWRYKHVFLMSSPEDHAFEE
ncbi:MAG: hypothetical protein HYV27_04820 [Candidatus Hydrogenedentes bacterium]|nr:hypothetical protein [Candidatus Hydrogenedentota bacterium]